MCKKLIIPVLILVIVVLGFSNWKSSTNTKTEEVEINTARTQTTAEVQKKYNELTKNITSEIVFPGIVAVHIFREEINGQRYLHATGGQLMGDKTILTCGHAFWNLPNEQKHPWKYYFQVLQPYERIFRPINKIVVIDKIEQNNVNASKDVMVCIPGAVSVINPINPPPSEVTDNLLTFKGFRALEPKQTVRSTVTGETVNLIGETQLVNGPGYYVLDCETFPSQSGTLFADTSGTKVYIVSRSIKLNSELRKIYNLNETHTGITLCSSVIIR